VSIRWKVIVPYLLLTLVVAITGVYVVTRLVASSLTERLTNQLLQAGRVVSDGMARQELSHVKTGRLVAYTRGLADALDASDSARLASLAKPAAAGLGIDSLTLVNAEGEEVLNLSRGADGQVAESGEPSQIADLPFVREQLDRGDPSGLPTRGLIKDPHDGRYYYYTALPVGLEGHVAGVVVVGTSLEEILPLLKSVSLADLIIYADDGQAISTTLAGQSGAGETMAALTVPADQIRQVIESGQIIDGANFTLDGRWYTLARGPLRVGDDRLGTFAVVLPLNFVLQSGSVSRNTYVLLFAAAMVAVVLVGYAISRLITNPLHALMRTSRAIAGGDLAQRSGIEGGDEIGVLASSFDEMTARLQERSAELEHTNHILEQMDRTKVRFIDVSAHELRTPLTLVKGYAQMMQLKSNGDPEMAMLSQGILDGSERINEIVGSMLDVSRIDSKALKIARAPVQMGLLMMRVRKTFQAALAERTIALHTEGLDSLPLIDADPDLLYKVFYHLLMNAIKYTPDGGCITVSGHAVEEAPGCSRVQITVADTGIGIDPEHQEMVFEKFYQTGEVMLHSSGKTKFKGGGPGLGLAIARGIIEAHSGNIRVESPGYDEQGCPGSAFHVQLPIGGAAV
jgi:signal transduction histidine kinase